MFDFRFELTSGEKLRSLVGVLLSTLQNFLSSLLAVAKLLKYFSLAGIIRNEHSGSFVRDVSDEQKRLKHISNGA
jgi:hypothetical protein